MRYHSVIAGIINNIKLLLVVDQISPNLLNNLDNVGKSKVHTIKTDNNIEIKKIPLLLSRFVQFLSKVRQPDELFISGIDFYYSKNIKECWLPGYAIKELSNYNSIAETEMVHDIRSNVEFIDKKLRENDWILCEPRIEEIIKLIIKEVKEGGDKDITNKQLKNVLNTINIFNSKSKHQKVLKRMHGFLKRVNLQNKRVFILGIEYDFLTEYLKSYNLVSYNSFKSNNWNDLFDEIRENKPDVIIMFNFVHYFPSEEFFSKIMSELNKLKVFKIVLNIELDENNESKFKRRVISKDKYGCYSYYTNDTEVSKRLSNYELDYSMKRDNKQFLAYRLNTELILKEILIF